MNIRTYITAAVFFLNGSIDNYYFKNEQDLQKEWMLAVYSTILPCRENKKNFTVNVKITLFSSL